MYATRHNPFVYFHSLIDSPACDANVVDFVRFDVDLAAIETTPNFSFITPNVCHDGHDKPCVDGQPGGLVSADQFLSELVPKILDSPAYRTDGMLIITLDEAQITNTAACWSFLTRVNASRCESLRTCLPPITGFSCPSNESPKAGGPAPGRLARSHVPRRQLSWSAML